MMRRRDFLRAGLTLAATWRTPGSIAAAAARVVVVGGGFAGSCCALALRRLSPATDIALIDPQSHYVTCPMSNEALVGLRSLDSLTTSRPGLRQGSIRYISEAATRIDAGNRRVGLRSGGEIAYDRLIVAPGIRLLWGKPEGYDERSASVMPHAWQAGEQTRLLAAQLRSLPDGGTVGISVPGGLMRCPPGPYERASLIAGWLRVHRPRGKVLIFDSNNHFPRQDVFMATWQDLYPGLIEWIPPTQGGAVTRVDARTCTLYSSTGSQRVSVANVIPPQAPGQLAADSGLATGHGWCPVDPLSFESQLIPGIHVIGDACIAGAMPKSASAARSQAHQCAVAVAALLQGQEVPSVELSSVCYSRLSEERALAIQGQFRIEGGEIRQVPATEAAQAPSQPQVSPPPPSAQAQPSAQPPPSAQAQPSAQPPPSAQLTAEAREWYADIRADAFGG